MKKPFRFIVLIVTVLFLSPGCEKEADDPATLLPGKWNQLSTQRIEYIDNVKQNETTVTYEAGKMVLEVYDDGTAKRFNSGVISDAFYWITDGNLFITTNGNGVEIKSEFSVNESELNLRWALQTTQDGHILRSDYSSQYKRAE
jgi:hypothetical protein